jgi:thioredoxin
MPGEVATSSGMKSPHTLTVTHDNFDATVARGVVVLDCSARWCAPCRVFAPVFAAAAARRPDLTWGTIDTDDEPGLAVVLDVRANPTIFVLRDGAIVHKHVGAMTAAKLDELIARVAPEAAASPQPTV